MAYTADNFIPESAGPIQQPAASVESPYPIPDRIRILRCLDGIFYSLLLSALLLLLCQLRFLFSRSQADLLILPLLVTCLASLRLPWPAAGYRRLERTLFKLKATALILTGLTPFTVWWLRIPETAYLTVGGSLAILTAAWYLMELTLFLGELLRHWDHPRLEREAQILHLLLFYGVFTPVLTLNTLFVWGYFFLPQIALVDLQTFWSAVPFWLQVIMLIPVVGTLVLLWQTRYVIPLHQPPVLPPAEVPVPCSPASGNPTPDPALSKDSVS